MSSYEPRTQEQQYISREVRDWLTTLSVELPSMARRADGTTLDRGEFLREIDEFFAIYLTTGPTYSRSIHRHIQNAVRWFVAGEGDLCDQSMCLAYNAKRNA